MAKPGTKPEPIKMKFVRWSSPSESNLCVDDEGVLESQAMRVVRTIGQAFEVCYKISQDQMQEKQQLEENESRMNIRLKGSTSNAIPEEVREEKEDFLSNRKPSACFSVNAEEGYGFDAANFDNNVKTRSSSPAQPPPSTTQKTRQSIYVTRKESSDVSMSQGDGSGNAAAALPPFSANTIPFSNPQQQNAEQHSPTLVSVIPTCVTPPTISTVHAPLNVGGIFPHAYQQMGVSSGTFTLPHSHTWGNPSLPSTTLNPYQPQLVPPFSTMQSLDAAASQPAFPFYSHMPSMLPLSAQMPYGLSSPMIVSPYATLQIPNSSALMADGSSGTTGSLQLAKTLDQYNLIRSQMDHVQQSAQVANCQVQFLRDQLSNETTARLEAQSRTSQLLNFQKDLLDQMNYLVTRLQKLETVYANDKDKPGTKNDITQHYERPTSVDNQSKQEGTINPSLPAQMILNNPITSFPSTPAVTSSSILPTPSNYNKPTLQQPYQVQTLADLRSGSLPPEDANRNTLTSSIIVKKMPKRPLAIGDDSGVRTEPDSATEDTTDYSSSDQYEKPGFLAKTNPDSAVNFMPFTLPYQTGHFNFPSTNPLSNYLQTIGQNSMGVQTTLTSTQASVAIPTVTSSSKLQTSSRPQLLQLGLNQQQQLLQGWMPPVVEASSFYQTSQIPNLPLSVPQASLNTATTGDSNVRSGGLPARQSSPKRQLRRFSLQALQRFLPDNLGFKESDSSHQSSSTKKSKPTGVFKEKKIGFSRMSFNTRLNSQPNKKQIAAEASTLYDVPEKAYMRDSRRRSSDVCSQSIGIGSNNSICTHRSISGGTSPARQIVAEFATATGTLPHHHQPTSLHRQSTGEVGLLAQRALASTSLATAMYPQVKKVHKISTDFNKKRNFPALSLDIDNPSSSGATFVLPTTLPYVMLGAAELTATAPSRILQTNVVQPNIDYLHQLDLKKYNDPDLLSTLQTNAANYNPLAVSAFATPPSSRKKHFFADSQLQAFNTCSDDNAMLQYMQLAANNNQLHNLDFVKGRTLQPYETKLLTDPASLEHLNHQYNNNLHAQEKCSSKENLTALPNGIL